jgi:hypothetical protein
VRTIDLVGKRRCERVREMHGSLAKSWAWVIGRWCSGGGELHYRGEVTGVEHRRKNEGKDGVISA